MKVCKILLKLFATVILGIFVYFMISFGGANENVIKLYSSLSAERSVNEIAKKYSFVAKYTYATGDITFAQQAGFTKEQAEVMQTQGTVGDTGDGSGGGGSGIGSNAPSSIDTDDMREMAKLICQSYLIGGKAYYVSSESHANSSVSYGTVTINGIDVPPYKSGSTYYRCCNGLSSALLKACNITNYRDGSSINGSWPYISCTDISGKIGTPINATTGADLKVGDIICVQSSGDANRSSHVETVVYVDNDYVYIASAGGDDSIANTAARGWHRKIGKTESLAVRYSNSMSSGWDGVREVVRP